MESLDCIECMRNAHPCSHTGSRASGGWLRSSKIGPAHFGKWCGGFDKNPFLTENPLMGFSSAVKPFGKP
jgi:hypothetical protein